MKNLLRILFAISCFLTALWICSLARIACAETLQEYLDRPDYQTFPTVKAEPFVPYTYRAYPVQLYNGMWHITGTPNSKQEIIDHLMTEGEHADVRAVYTRQDLEGMSRDQLRTMHDHSHRHVLVNIKQTTAYYTPVTTTTVSRPPAVYYNSNCPGGNCPMPTRGRARNGNGGTRIRTNFFTGVNFF